MKNWWVLIIIIFLLTGAFWLGFKAHARFRPCPEVKTDTLYVYDTIYHEILDSFPVYIIKKDTVIVNHNIPAIVDTAAILCDYYSIHYYTRDWYDINQSDTLIHIRLEDAIMENMPIDNNFSYRWYKPQTVINNVVNNVSYSSYLYAGISAPLNDYKFAAGSVYFASDRLLLGIGYIPYYKSLSVTGGIKLARFKKK
jgi:hypothetical protein